MTDRAHTEVPFRVTMRDAKPDERRAVVVCTGAPVQSGSCVIIWVGLAWSGGVTTTARSTRLASSTSDDRSVDAGERLLDGAVGFWDAGRPQTVRVLTLRKPARKGVC
jgi:hypothetical protein